MQLAQNLQEVIILLQTSCTQFFAQPRTDEVESSKWLHSIERLRYLSEPGNPVQAEVTPIDFEADLNSEEYANIRTFGAPIEIKKVIKTLKRIYLPSEKAEAKQVKPKASLYG